MSIRGGGGARGGPPGRPAGRLPAKREAILHAAVAVFLREGYARASVEAIADRAGVSKQTVYNHFGDKERLFLAAVEGERQRVAARFTPEPPTGPAAQSDLPRAGEADRAPDGADAARLAGRDAPTAQDAPAARGASGRGVPAREVPAREVPAREAPARDAPAVRPAPTEPARQDVPATPAGLATSATPVGRATPADPATPDDPVAGPAPRWPAAGDARAALAGYGRQVLAALLDERASALRRLIIAEAGRHPALLPACAQGEPEQLVAAGAELLRHRTEAGELDVPDPAGAARQLVALLVQRGLHATMYGTRPLPEAQAATLCDEAAELFVRAYRA